MPAKTCLHCGKTLVFIRVGAGGDFCSREHRNQYQLRRGMDCLAEANKVATLARRRETPKALFGEAATGSAGAQPRPFSGAAPFGLLMGLHPGLKSSRKTARIHLLSRSEELHALAPSGPAEGAPREFAVVFTARGRVAMSGAAKTSWKPSGLAGKAVRGLRRVAVSPAPGTALRVSSSVGFHLKAPGSRQRFFTAHKDSAGMITLGARAASLPFAVMPEQPGAPPDARFTFIDMGFSTAPDAPARLAWLQAGRTPVVPEQRES